MVRDLQSLYFTRKLLELQSFTTDCVVLKCKDARNFNSMTISFEVWIICKIRCSVSSCPVSLFRMSHPSPYHFNGASRLYVVYFELLSILEVSFLCENGNLPTLHNYIIELKMVTLFSNTLSCNLKQLFLRRDTLSWQRSNFDPYNVTTKWLTVNMKLSGTRHGRI
jgi:hypothetical protein